MASVLYTCLHSNTLEVLQRCLQDRNVTFEEATEASIKESFKRLPDYQVLLIGEAVENPIRYAQEAYGQDKNISILLVNDSKNYSRIKQALQFSPFIGPTVQSISNEVGARMVPIIEDAMQRTAQRRSFAKLKTSPLTKQQFVPKSLEKVRTEYTTKVLAEAPIGAVLISGAGLVFSINMYALDLFKKSEKDVLGSSVADLFPEQLQADVKQFLQDGYLNEPKQVFEVPLTDDKLFLELSVAPIDAKSSANYKLLILNNITTTVLAQQRTQAHLQELEKLNADLARVNADLDTFVYTASHDLKSPILNIEGLIASLEEELGTARSAVETELMHIKRSIGRFKQTVEELTEITRVQRSFEHEAALLEMPALLEEVLQLLEREISESGAVIEADFKCSTLFFPKRNLNSILYNLISNAIKYRHPKRKPDIRIKTWLLNDYFYLAVKDNGLGVPEQKKEGVFKLFKRMHAHVQGSGVGLYIVKRIVDNNNGEITLDTNEGEGSEFTVRFKIEGEVPALKF